MEGITLEPKRNNKRARRGAHGHPAACTCAWEEEELQNTRNILPPTPLRGLRTKESRTLSIDLVHCTADFQYASHRVIH